jgi:leader peptidase (prepilin peptidase) / N-methyltransferase
MILMTLFGWLVGVGLNHLADFLPGLKGLGWVSRCPQCGQAHSRSQWSAVLAFMRRQLYCPNCGQPLALRRVLVELLLPTLFVFLLSRYGPSLQLGWLLLYTTILVLITIIDLEHKLILHVVILPAILLATIGGFFNDDFSWRRAMLGGAFGFAFVLVLFWLAPKIMGLMQRLLRQKSREVPLGFGDVTLATFIGLITGFPASVFALSWGILLGGLGALVYLFVKGLILRRYTLFTAIPYGPYLAFAGWIVMVWGQEILDWYL